MSAVARKWRLLDEKTFFAELFHQLCKWHKVSFEVQILLSKFKFKFKLHIRSSNSNSKYELLTLGCPRFPQVDHNYIFPLKKHVVTDSDREFVRACIDWFCSFTNYVETKLEEDCSIASLEQWIVGAEVTPALKTFAQTYWQKGLKPLLTRLCQHHFQHVYCSNLAANSFTDSDNAALKGDKSGPRPNESIDRSHNAILNHEERQMAGLRTRAL
jgi:hypothetical protein